MLNIDVDEIVDVEYTASSKPGESDGVAITFKDGTTRVFSGADFVEAIAILNHWTPPTA